MFFSLQLNHPKKPLLENILVEYILGHLRNKNVCIGIIKDKCIKSQAKQNKPLFLLTSYSMINSSISFQNIMWKILNYYIHRDTVKCGFLGLNRFYHLKYEKEYINSSFVHHTHDNKGNLFSFFRILLFFSSGTIKAWENFESCKYPLQKQDIKESVQGAWCLIA